MDDIERIVRLESSKEAHDKQIAELKASFEELRTELQAERQATAVAKAKVTVLLIVGGFAGWLVANAEKIKAFLS